MKEQRRFASLLFHICPTYCFAGPCRAFQAQPGKKQTLCQAFGRSAAAAERPDARSGNDGSYEKRVGSDPAAPPRPAAVLRAQFAIALCKKVTGTLRVPSALERRSSVVRQK
jgi:hypothetical protein